MNNLKKGLIASVISLFVVSLSAQTDAGKFLIGGSSSLDFAASTEKWKTDDDDGTYGKGMAFNLTPQFGYFVIDGLAVGLELEVTMSSFKDDEDDGKSTVTGLVAAPFVRYYFGASKIKPFAEAAVGFGTYTDKYDPSDGESSTDKYGIFAYQIKAGAGFFLNDVVSLDMGVAYRSMSVKQKEDNDNNYKDITSQIGLEIGIIVVL